MRALGIVVVWVGAAAASLVVAWKTAVGPVVVSFGGSSHGLHVGDVMGAGLSAAGATLATLGLRRGRVRSGDLARGAGRQR